MRSRQSKLAILTGSAALGLALAAGAAAAQPGGDHGQGGGQEAHPQQGHDAKDTRASAPQGNSQKGNSQQGNSQQGKGQPGTTPQDRAPQGNAHQDAPARSDSGARNTQGAKAGNDHAPAGQSQGRNQGQQQARKQTESHANQGAGAPSHQSGNPNASKGEGKAQGARPQSAGRDQDKTPATHQDRGNQGGQEPRYVAHRSPREDLKKVTYTNARGHRIEVPTNDRVRVVTSARALDWDKLDRRASYDGCPPGLAKKYNGCTPPGLDRSPQHDWGRPSWFGNAFNRDDDYRYVDGYMVRLGSGSSILNYVPLLAGALAVGNVWPGSYDAVALPDYYDSYYDLGDAGGYRYYGNTIYRVDPQTSRINSVAALLTGNDIVVGQPMPMGYDVYNVPYGYRDQYYDTDAALYRYSDGYIYQLDPTTRLVQAAIELLS